MSIKINIEDFHSWSEIFLEIERQTNLKKFAIRDPGSTSVDRQERKLRSMSLSEPVRKEIKEVNEKRYGHRKSNEPRPTFPQMDSQRTYKEEGKRSGQEAIRRKRALSEVQPRARLNSTTCPTMDTDTWQRLTDAARKLREEQMALSYEDSIKPLDIYFILRQRRAQMQEDDEQF